MRKSILLFALAVGGILLLGCNNRTMTQSESQQWNTELKPMPQYWYGVLPCGDCEGIETSLYLEKTGHWTMREHYRSASQPASFTSQGNWARTADKLVLTSDDGSHIYFKVKDDALEQTDSDGNTAASGLSYTLHPTMVPETMVPETRAPATAPAP